MKLLKYILIAGIIGSGLFQPTLSAQVVRRGSPATSGATNNTAQTITNTTTETSIFSDTIASGKLGLDKTLTLSIYCTVTSLLTPPNITVRVKFGGSTLTVLNNVSINVNTTAKPFLITVVLANKGVANAQYCLGIVQQHQTTGPLSGTIGTFAEDTDFAIDTTADQTLQVTVQNASLIGTTTLTVKHVGYTIN